ncbi:MAG: hypothetical protein WAN35_08910 [Terracidiphilus sp.]
MRPNSESKHLRRQLFQIDLERLIDLEHPLAVLAQKIDWEQFDLLLGRSYHPKRGASGTPARLVVV